MNKKTTDKVKYIANQVENGIEELGRESNIIIQANTIIKTKKSNMPAFVFVVQQFAKVFSERINLNASTYRIFFHFMALMEYENFISVDIETISENLSLSPRTVIRGIKDLEDLNIVKKTLHINDKRRHEYFINPIAVWKGNSNSRSKSIKKAQENNSKSLELPFEK
jgi:predicted transcriptional regulator